MKLATRSVHYFLSLPLFTVWKLFHKHHKYSEQGKYKSIRFELLNFHLYLFGAYPFLHAIAKDWTTHCCSIEASHITTNLLEHVDIWHSIPYIRRLTYPMGMWDLLRLMYMSAQDFVTTKTICRKHLPNNLQRWKLFILWAFLLVNMKKMWQHRTNSMGILNIFVLIKQLPLTECSTDFMK